MVSPSNIATALALSLAGAGGRTAEQIAAALRVDPRDEGVHDRVAALLRHVASPELHAATRLWGNLELEPDPLFLSIARNDYGAPFDVFHGRNAVDVANEMNAWVSERTAGRIADLVSPADITPLTKLVLIATLYFKARWCTPFHRSQTRDTPFRRRDGTTVDVPMMSLHEHLGYASTPLADVVELEFDPRTTASRGPRDPADRSSSAPATFSLLLALPKAPSDEVGIAEVASAPTTVRRRTGEFLRPEVILKLPRFRITSTLDLKTTLAAMGITDMLSEERADFTKITDCEALWLETAKHRTVMDVDEDGATATAATFFASTNVDAAPPPRPIVLRFDRPFLFLLRENRSGLVAFAGWVEDPRS